MKILFSSKAGVVIGLFLLSFSLVKAQILNPSVSTPYSTDQFCDVHQGDFGYDAIKELKYQGMVKGYGNGCFKPEQSITKAEFVFLLSQARIATRAASEKGTYKVPGPYFVGPYIEHENPFKDVSIKDWYYEDLMHIYNEGALKVNADKNFRGNSTISKGEALNLMYNISRQLKREKNTTEKFPFVNIKPKSTYYKAIFSFWQNKLLLGNEKNNFKPNARLKRGEAAVLILNFINYSTMEPEYL